MRKRLFTKKLSKENLVRFFNKEGFYVVVFLCIAIIATTAVYVMRNNMDYFSRGDGNEINDHYDDHEYFQPENIHSSPEDQQQSLEEDDSENKEIPDEEPKEGEMKNDEKDGVEKARPSGIIPENAQAVVSTKLDNGSAKDILNKMKNPVESTSITMDFSFQSVPVFSTTLNEYRSDHQGIDISAEKGTEVKASMDGKVVEIIQDPRVGMLVIIDHGNEVMTKYGNLDKEVLVTKNQQVKRGDVLGKVGNTAMFEINDEPHVHFEIWKGEKPVDPKDYIKELEKEG